MIFLDVETTGLKKEKHSIASVGAVYLEYPNHRFYEECRIWDGAEIEEEALKINGFTRESLADPKKHSLKETMISFLKWASECRDKTLGGENPSFDREFISSSLGRYSIKSPFGARTIDLHTTSYNHHKMRGVPIPINKERTNISLDTTLEYAGLPAEPKPHHALNGALMEAEAYNRLIYGRKLLPEFSSHKIPVYLIQHR